MDLTRPVTYRGLLLTGAQGGPGGNNPIDGFRLTTVDYSDLTVHGYTEKKSLEDGMDSSDVYVGMRRILMQGECFASSKARLFELLDTLRLKFTPTDCYAENPYRRGYLPLSFSQPTPRLAYWPTGFVDRVMYARPTAQPRFSLEYQALGGEAGRGYVVPFQVSMECIDPRIYAPVQSEFNLSGYSGSGTIQNRGNYPTAVNFVLVMAAVHASQYRFAWSGLGSNFELTFPSFAVDRTLRLDSIDKVVTLEKQADETLRMDLVSFLGGTTYPKALPVPEGDPSPGYTWTCDGPLSPLSRVWWREAWI